MEVVHRREGRALTAVHDIVRTEVVGDWDVEDVGERLTVT
jgi:hypothetical protein